MKDACAQGHPYPESKRPGRSDCAVCHREREAARLRARGVPQRGPVGSNWSCGHDPATSMRATVGSCGTCHRQREQARYRRESDKQKAAATEWVRKNRERRNAYLRQYYTDNLEHMRAYSRDQQRSRAFDRANTDAQDYAAILRLDPCSYCGAPTEAIDHITPKSKGGGNEWDNLTAACKSCNSEKKARPLLTFLLARAA